MRSDRFIQTNAFRPTPSDQRLQSQLSEPAVQLSICLITRDEQHHIERCLRSVAFADEWVVLDSGSRDNTLNLARSMGASVYSSPDWPGFGRQKNRVLDLARGDWIFSIDADEWVSEELAQAIAAAIRVPTHDAYWVSRRSRFCGKLIRFGDWGGDRVVRLFRRHRARFSDDVVHERVVADLPFGRLNGYLWHDSVESLADGREKMLRYAQLGAAKIRERARARDGPTLAGVRGFWTFVRGYLFRGGFLDGREGLQIARLNARGTYLRYRWSTRSEAEVEQLAELESRRHC